ncbi:MAG: DHH family phosphoesterase [Porticoccaceae bacterium]
MADFDIFNGDADGITALLQLRLAEPREAQLVTGVKRDIALLERPELSEVGEGDHLVVLDLSLDKNRAPLEQFLERGAEVFYCDHHYAGAVPGSSRLLSLINEAPEVCTSLLVNGYLRGRFAAWAVVGAFGDNLHDSARRLAVNIGLNEQQSEALCELGELLNYNGYGESLSDLHFHPAELFIELLEFESPLELIENAAPALTALRAGYAEDVAACDQVETLLSNVAGIVKLLPNAPWARRISGVWANQLARENPDSAVALLTEKTGGYLVSVRAPLSRRTGAARLCRQFASGGGREAAAGINLLAEQDRDKFLSEFSNNFISL